MLRRHAERVAIARVCRLRSALNDAVHAFYTVLEQYTMEDVVAERRPLAKILFTTTKPARLST
jgi:Rrf2 family transcriptional regulator, nitric oxide-sensitive transcriptional repressor